MDPRRPDGLCELLVPDIHDLALARERQIRLEQVRGRVDVVRCSHPHPDVVDRRRRLHRAHEGICFAGHVGTAFLHNLVEKELASYAGGHRGARIAVGICGCDRRQGVLAGDSNHEIASLRSDGARVVVGAGGKGAHARVGAAPIDGGGRVLASPNLSGGEVLRALAHGVDVVDDLARRDRAVGGAADDDPDQVLGPIERQWEGKYDPSLADVESRARRVAVRVGSRSSARANDGNVGVPVAVRQLLVVGHGRVQVKGFRARREDRVVRVGAEHELRAGRAIRRRTTQGHHAAGGGGGVRLVHVEVLQDVVRNVEVDGVGGHVCEVLGGDGEGEQVLPEHQRVGRRHEGLHRKRANAHLEVGALIVEGGVAHSGARHARAGLVDRRRLARARSRHVERVGQGGGGERRGDREVLGHSDAGRLVVCRAVLRASHDNGVHRRGAVRRGHGNLHQVLTESEGDVGAGHASAHNHAADHDDGVGVRGGGGEGDLRHGHRHSKVIHIGQGVEVGHEGRLAGGRMLERHEAGVRNHHHHDGVEALGDAVSSHDLDLDAVLSDDKPNNGGGGGDVHLVHHSGDHHATDLDGSVLVGRGHRDTDILVDGVRLGVVHQAVGAEEGRDVLLGLVARRVEQSDVRRGWVRGLAELEGVAVLGHELQGVELRGGGEDVGEYRGRQAEARVIEGQVVEVEGVVERVVAVKAIPHCELLSLLLVPLRERRVEVFKRKLELVLRPVLAIQRHCHIHNAEVDASGHADDAGPLVERIGVEVLGRHLDVVKLAARGEGDALRIDRVVKGVGGLEIHAHGDALGLHGGGRREGIQLDLIVVVKGNTRQGEVLAVEREEDLRVPSGPRRGRGTHDGGGEGVLGKEERVGEDHLAAELAVEGAVILGDSARELDSHPGATGHGTDGGRGGAHAELGDGAGHKRLGDELLVEGLVEVERRRLREVVKRLGRNHLHAVEVVVEPVEVVEPDRHVLEPPCVHAGGGVDVGGFVVGKEVGEGAHVGRVLLPVQRHTEAGGTDVRGRGHAGDRPVGGVCSHDLAVIELAVRGNSHRRGIEVRGERHALVQANSHHGATHHAAAGWGDRPDSRGGEVVEVTAS
mmetsp:Transcript_14484/g.46047  ORF Transcript_14484/g.46047 Transcript_14484/m.46047 type:complete len:1097 (+) Transcript_14484:761-4051(+)